MCCAVRRGVLWCAVCACARNEVPCVCSVCTVTFCGLLCCVVRYVSAGQKQTPTQPYQKIVLNIPPVASGTFPRRSAEKSVCTFFHRQNLVLGSLPTFTSGDDPKSSSTLLWRTSFCSCALLLDHIWRVSVTSSFFLGAWRWPSHSDFVGPRGPAGPFSITSNPSVAP